MAKILDKIMHNGDEYDLPEGIPSGGTDGQFLGKVSGDTAWADAPVTSVNGNTGVITVNEVPSGGNNGDVLTNVSGTPTWAAPSGGDVMVSTQAGNTLTPGTKVWAGSEADYNALAGNYDSNTRYYVF